MQPVHAVEHPPLRLDEASPHQRVRPEGGRGGLVHLHERAARGRKLPKDRIRRVGGPGQVVIERLGRVVAGRGTDGAPWTEDHGLDRRGR